MKLVLLLLVAAFSQLPLPSRSQPTVREYETYQLLEDALLASNFNLYVLSQTFYPKIGSVPICQPVDYHVTCNESCDACLDCTAPGGYNTSYLWTLYDVDQPIGPLLLSYANNGIILRGFDWEDACLFLNEINLTLVIDVLNQSDTSLILESLREMTAVLKGYAKAQGTLSLGDSDTMGFAIAWNEEDRERRVFHISDIILTTIIVMLNIVTLLSAIGMTNYLYDKLYRSITREKPPGHHPAGYPIFWSIVFLTVCWNVAPSWLVLQDYGFRVYWSLAFMLPLELIVAISVKKKSNFPVPCFRGCPLHNQYHYMWDRTVVMCFRCLLNHIFQTMAIWTILVFLTFIVYYLSAVVIVFFIYPIQTLVKVVFLKGVAVSVVINIALVISVSRFHFRCTSKACKHNLKAAFKMISALTFLPILAYISLIIGMILFSNSSQASNLQNILTLIPSLSLVVGAWYSRGHLFPEQTDEVDAGGAIVQDLEGGQKGNTDPPVTSHGSLNVPNQHSSPERLSLHSGTPLSNYNSLGSQLPLVASTTRLDYTEPLLPPKT